MKPAKRGTARSSTHRPPAIICIDENGIVQSANPATKTILGYEADELLGANVSKIMPDYHASRHDGYLDAYLETGVGKIIGIGREVTARRKDGGMIDVELSVGEWRDDAGRRFFAGALRDISARKRAEEELARARRLESASRLTAGFAHDFNNILTVLAANLELILQSTSDDRIRGLALPALEAAETGAFLNRRLMSLGRKRRHEPASRQPERPDKRNVRTLCNGPWGSRSPFSSTSPRNCGSRLPSRRKSTARCSTSF